MKVVLLSPLPPPMGGIASWTQRMMNATLKNGWSFTVVDEKAIGNRQVFGKGNKRSFLLEIKRCRLIWKNLKIALRDDQVKVVHSSIPSSTPAMIREYVCARITKKAKKKFIIHFHCTVPNTVKGRLGVFVLKKLCRKSDMIFALNEQAYRYLEKITDTKIKIIPNFISKDELSDSYIVRPEIKRAVYVGGVIAAKGAYDVLKIAREIPDIQFRLVGAIDTDIEKFAQDSKLTNVIFTGLQDRAAVKKELHEADVFIFLSHFRGEGFSVALVEAMAAGLPCLVTDWAANADMIENKGGIVVEIGDIDAAISAIEKMKDADIRTQMSRFNTEKVREYYCDSVVLDKFTQAYEEVLENE